MVETTECVLAASMAARSEDVTAAKMEKKMAASMVASMVDVTVDSTASNKADRTAGHLGKRKAASMAGLMAT